MQIVSETRRMCAEEAPPSRGVLASLALIVSRVVQTDVLTHGLAMQCF